MNNTGMLTRDAFAVAMHLVFGALAGKEIPTSLPPSLVPPPMRASIIGNGSNVQSRPQQTDATTNLLWDSPPNSPFSSSPPTQINRPQFEPCMFSFFPSLVQTDTRLLQQRNRSWRMMTIKETRTSPFTENPLRLATLAISFSQLRNHWRRPKRNVLLSSPG
jgi:hypothetical protein